MERRSFLKLSAMALLGAALGGRGASANPPSAAPHLIVVELRGGNDGLNTVIPYKDPLYKSLRPGLGVGRSEVLGLSEELGFNPALKPLMGAWDAGDLAVVLGLGYDDPDRSHFRSAEVWEAASTKAQTGWGVRLLPGRGVRPALDAIVIGSDAGLTYQSPDLTCLTINRPAQIERLLASSGHPTTPPRPTGHAALDHIRDTEYDHDRALMTLQEATARAPLVPAKAFPAGATGAAFRLAARLVAAQVPVSVLHVTLKGFDTHARQRAAHDRLLGDLAQSLSALREHLIASGHWSNTALMTCSEFGRRPAENGGQGTDHGTANPHLIMGGLISGGLYGRQPPLGDLDPRGDLVATCDFRRPLNDLSRRCWGLAIDETLEPLGFIKA